ncbi:MAG: hypothetical protein JNJ69_05645 [Leptospiraceae bacterium]|nr:hypothetical protein [Leptospiraceae bacterium]
MKKFRFAVLFAISTALVIGGGCKSGNQKTVGADGWVEVTGVAAVQNGNLGLAKDEALKDAKRVAVQEVLGSIVSARTDVKNFQLVQQSVTSKTEGLIETFSILSAAATSDTEYQVRIKAKVSTALVTQAIEEVVSSQGKPRMMVIIDESFNGRSDSNKVAQTEIETQFIAQGFPFVDRSTVERLVARNKRKIASALGGDNSAARSLGVDAGAEIILVGTSRVKEAGKISGTQMISVQADLNVRVIDINTGKILTAGQEHGAYPHINAESGAVEAVKKAVTPLRDKLVTDIVKLWDINRGNTIALLITGVDYEKLMVLRSELIEKVRGVKAVNPKGSSGKAAKLEVEFEGSSFDLADRLLTSGLSVKLKIGDVKPNSLDVSAK